MTAPRSIRRGSAVFLLVLLAVAFARAEDAPPPVKMTAQEDHQKMMDALGIKELRRGADGRNQQAPNYQNTEEAKANPWPNLPDPLMTKDGQKVTTAEQWWTKRRPEIVEDFDREVYGRGPKDTPKDKWEVTATPKQT